MDVREVLESVAFGLIVIGLVAAVLFAIFGIPILIGWAVFSVVSSPIDPIVRGVIFAVYTVGIFLAGVYITGYTYESNIKNIRELVDRCEDKAASISRDVRRCGDDVRSSVESKVYDVLMCLKAIRENI
jgi:hypothetical protein